ncbi:MAG: DUF1385 domain-containing protein [Solirubrobacteraceae bacterium]|nr:DUF1385 domain-containing protein [Solirubrobacteraceae bacterium]
MPDSVQRLSDGTLVASRDAPVGGQAVLEGVMMRGTGHWAVAVREREGGGIAVQRFALESVTKRHRALRWPVVRGAVALWESLGIGLQALKIAANAQLAEDEEPISRRTWVGTVVVALVMAVCLFFLLPVGLANLLGDRLPNSVAFVVVEKLIRVSVFLLYLYAVTRLRDLQRVFEYHGAEHKTISCYEAGLDLTPENAQRFSRLHPRCGTSFLLIVMIVSVFVFAPLGRPEWHWLLISRVVGIPLIAGLSFEVIKGLGRNRSHRWARILMWPGLQLQRLTTREPDHDQLAVAIAALDSVLEVEEPGAASDEDAVALEVAA